MKNTYITTKNEKEFVLSVYDDCNEPQTEEGLTVRIEIAGETIKVENESIVKVNSYFNYVQDDDHKPNHIYSYSFNSTKFLENYVKIDNQEYRINLKVEDTKGNKGSPIEQSYRTSIDKNVYPECIVSGLEGNK